MKKLILFFSMILMVSPAANAQCTPDPQYTDPGVYPDSATGFDTAYVGIAYDQLITNVVPVDTTTMIGPIPVTLTFDSAVVVSLLGLPAGFTYSCYDAQNTTSPPDQCCFEGGTTGCVSITGNPTAADIGTYPLSITVDVYLEGGTTPTASQIIEYYSIVIEDTVGIPEYEKSAFKLFPNPVSESFIIEGLDGLSIDDISITNTEGKILKSYYDLNAASYGVNVENLEAGVYFVRIAHGTSTEVIRFIKE